MDRAQARWDAGVGALLVAIGAAFLWDARDLPPGYFEPVGPGPVPRATAWMVVVLAGVVIANAARRLARGAPAPEPLPYAPRPDAAAAVVAITALYVAAMGLGFVGYAPATVAYLVLTIALLAEWRRRVLPTALAIGIVMGFGLQYLFTRVLVTDLP